jgi:hypothetical protein
MNHILSLNFLAICFAMMNCEFLREVHNFDIIRFSLREMTDPIGRSIGAWEVNKRVVRQVKMALEVDIVYYYS